MKGRAHLSLILVVALAALPPLAAPAALAATITVTTADDMGAYGVQLDERYRFCLPLVFRNAP